MFYEVDSIVSGKNKAEYRRIPTQTPLKKPLKT